MKKFNITTCICLVLLSGSSIIKAQDLHEQRQTPISLNEYLTNVTEGNLEFIANQFNVSIAEAELQAARVFADPEVAFEYSNNEDRTMQMGQSYSTGISYPFSFGNKRGAAIGFARTRMELEQSILEAWLQNLRADASLAYYSALRDFQVFRLQEDSYDRLRQLAGADSIRFIAGDINEIDASRSRLEARAQQYELNRSRSMLINSLLELSRLQGRHPGDTLYVPSDGFPMMRQELNLNELIERSLQNRAELTVAIKSNELTERQLRLIRAERAPEFSLEGGYAHNTIVNNEIAPAPPHTSYTAGIVIPFKFSNYNKGQILAAKLATEQSNMIRQDVENRIITEVRQAYNVYAAMNRQIENYSRDLLQNAERILEGRTFMYQRGETGLIDVLEAQRTFNELQIQYYQVMYDYAAALIELRRAQAIE